MDLLFDRYEPEKSGYDDPWYEYINGNTSVESYLRGMGKESYGEGLGALYAGLAENSGELAYFTDDERKIYNYLYATKGKNAAEDFVNYLSEDLNLRQRIAYEDNLRKYANEHPIISSIGSVATSPLKTLSYVGQLADYIPDGKMEKDAAYNLWASGNAAVRQEVSSKVEKNWGSFASGAYNIGMGLADFLFTTAATGGNKALSLAIMGTSAAADATLEAKDRGLSDDQAFALGTIAGATEIAMEFIPLDNLLKTNQSKSWLVAIIKQGLSEAGEEVGSELVNTIADIIISQDKSRWELAIQGYLDSGEAKNRDEAFQKAFGAKAFELLNAAAGGFMSGGMLGASAYGINVAVENHRLTNMDADGIISMIDEGLAAPKDTDSYRLATYLQNKADSGETLTVRDLRALDRANATVSSKQPDTMNSPENPTSPTPETGAAATPSTADPHFSPAGPINMDDVIDESMAQLTGAPADPVAAALDTVKAGGTVSNNQARDILNNLRAIRYLQEKTGMKLIDDRSGGTASSRRAAVKEAIAQLAAMETETVDTAPSSDTSGIKAQLRNSQDTLNAMDSVADIQAPDNFSDLDIAQKKDWVIEKLRPTGYKVERKGFGLISFAKKQLKAAFNYFKKGSVEELTFEAVPYVLERGVEISSHPDHKGREYGTVTIAAPVTVNGKRGNMAVVVKQTSGNTYKVHRIISPDGSVFDLSETKSEAELTPTGEAPETGSLATSKSSASDNSIPDSGEIVNPTTSVGAAAPTVPIKAIPKTSGGSKKSKIYTNTYKNATGEAVRSIGEESERLDPNIAYYDPVSEKESFMGAVSRTRTPEAINTEYERLMSKDGWGSEDNDTAMLVMDNLRKNGDSERFHNLADKQRKMGTQGGQLSQSFAKYTHTSPTYCAAEAINQLYDLKPSDVPYRFYAPKVHELESGDGSSKTDTPDASDTTTSPDTPAPSDSSDASEASTPLDDLEPTDVSRKFYKEQGFEAWRKEVAQSILDLANQIESVGEGNVAEMRDVVRSLARFRHTTAWLGYTSRLSKVAESALSTIDYDTAKAISLAQLSQITADFRKRPVGQIVKTIRIHNMLAALTTVNRNIVGNVACGVVDGLSDSTVGRGLDALVSKITGKRTVGNDVTHAKTYFKAASKATKLAALCAELDIPMNSESRFSTGYTRTFSPQGGVFTKFFGAFEKAMKYNLEVTDQFFEGGTTGAVEKSLQDLGKKSNLTDAEVEAISSKAGQRRTFKDDRMLTRAAKTVKKGLNEVGTGNHGLGDMSMAMVGTGTNVAHTAADYSGAGIVTGLFDIARLIKDVKTGAYKDVVRYENGVKYTDKVKEIKHWKTGETIRTVTLAEAQRQAVTNAARGITGIGLISAFTALAIKGIIKVHNDKDKDERALDQSQNLSGAQFNFSAMIRALEGEDTDWQQGDWTVSIDFLEPFNAQMYIGYALSQEDEVQDMVKAYPGAAFSGVYQSILDMPMIQSLSETIKLAEDVGNAVEDGDATTWWDVGGYLLGSYGTSFIPAWLRQTAHMIDNNYRDTSDDDPLKAAWNQMKSHLPWLSETLPKKYDGLGNEQIRHNGGIEGALNTFVLPGEVEQIYPNEMADRLDQISGETGDKSIYPESKAPSGFEYTDEKGEKHAVTISGESMTETYQKTYGDNVNKLYGELMDSTDFTALTSDQQADVLKKAKAYATQLAKASVSDYDEVPAYIRDRPEGMSEAEAILRQTVAGTTTKYTDVPIDTAAFVAELMRGIEPEGEYKSVRDIQQMEAVVESDELDAYVEKLLPMYMEQSTRQRYQTALDEGYTSDEFVAAYRLYLDRDKELSKTRQIKELAAELDMDYRTAKTLWEIYSEKPD
ncbi:MAG: hypothetical protein IJB11_04310 [Oscillospiraceae bacterium]|nr:hypothetical protein [Oscillospiraceae bacterium]